METVHHLFLGFHHKAGKGRVGQALGLHILHDAELHVAAGQTLSVLRNAVHGCLHNVVIRHGSKAVQFLLFPQFLLRLFCLPLSFALGFGGIKFSLFAGFFCVLRLRFLLRGFYRLKFFAERIYGFTIQRYLKSIILGVAVHHINFREYTHCSVLSKKGRELPDGNSLP